MRINLISRLAIILIIGHLLAGCAIFVGTGSKPGTPGNASYYVQEGDRYFDEGSYDKAIESYAAAVKKEPKSVETRRKLGETYAKRGIMDLALGEFTKIISLDPSYIHAYNFRGYIYSKQGKWDEAVKEFESSLKIDSQNIYALSHLGLVYKMMGKNEDARAILMRAAELDPEMNDPESKNTHNSLGLLYKDEGKIDEAIAEYSKTAEHFPVDTTAHNRLGELYEAKSMFDEAIREYNATLAVASEDAYAKSRLEALQAAGLSIYKIPSVEIIRDDVNQYISSAPDASQYPGAGAVILLDKISYEILGTGMTRYTIHQIVKIFNERGIAEFGEISIPFNARYQNIDVNVARTILPDGTEISAASDAEHDITLPGISEYNMYSDIMLRIVSMPALEPGVIIEYKVTLEDAQEGAEKPWIWGSMNFQWIEPVINAKCVLRAPKDMEIEWRLQNCNIDPVITEDNQNLTYIWISKNNPEITVETAMPPLDDVIPEVIFSSTKSWDEVYKWYKELSSPQEQADKQLLFSIGLDFQSDFDSGKISPNLLQEFKDNSLLVSQSASILIKENGNAWQVIDNNKSYDVRMEENKLNVYDEPIKRKVEELTAGKDTTDKIKAIYEFVSSEIRYVAIELGQSAYQPNTAISIFLCRYGDCKDKTTLLIAMLREAGIDAYQVLISPAPGKSVNLELPSIAQFSHVIAAIPMKGSYVWLDPTASTCKYGDLPAGDQGRKAFVIGKDKGEFADTPVFPSDSNKITSISEITVSEDGAISGWEQTIANGQSDIYLKAVYRLIRPDKVKEFLESIFNQRYPGMQINNVAISDLYKLDMPIEVKVDFSCPNYASDIEGAMILPLPSEDFSSYAALVGGNAIRQYDFHLGYNMSVEKVLIISLPKGYRAVSLPRDISINHEFGNFARKYEGINDSTIRYSASLKFNTHVIPPDRYNDLKALMETAAREDRAQIILSKPSI